MKQLGVLLLPLDVMLVHHRVPRMKELGSTPAFCLASLAVAGTQGETAWDRAMMLLQLAQRSAGQRFLERAGKCVRLRQEPITHGLLIAISL